MINANLKDILSWLDNVYSALLESNWAKALSFGGVNLLYSCRSQVVIELLRYFRDDHIFKPSIEKTKLSIYDEIRTSAYHQYLYLKYKLKNKHYPKADIVFWPVEPTHLEQQIPVSEELKKLNIDHFFISDRPAIIESLKSNDRKVFKIYRTLHRRSGDMPSSYTVKKILPGDPDIELPEIDDENFHKNLFEIMRKTLISSLLGFYTSIAATDKLVEEAQPQVLIVGNDYTLEGVTAAMRARKYGVSTACIMHGNLTNELHKYHYADEFLAFGNHGKSFLQELGVSEDKIEVCGAPYLDTKPKQKGIINPLITEKLSLDTAKPYVLILVSGPGNSVSVKHHKLTIEALKELTNSYEGVQFVAKLHRKDRIEYYRNGDDDSSMDRLILVEYNRGGFPDTIFEWLQGCGAVLTGASTAGLEALLMDVPVITMDFCEELEEVSYINAGVTIHVTSFEELKQAVKDVLAESPELEVRTRRAKKYLEDHFYKLDGYASKRIVEAISRLADKSHSQQQGS